MHDDCIKITERVCVIIKRFVINVTNTSKMTNDTSHQFVLTSYLKTCETGNGTACNVSDFYYYYVDEPYNVMSLSKHVTVLAVIFPLIGVLTILGNMLVIYIFCKQKLRTPTSVLLIELAIADTLVCFPIVVIHIYLYSMGNHAVYLPYKWCIIHHIGYLVQQVFRSTANWLTAMLGVQRFIAVTFPFRAQRICTVKMSIISFFVFLFASIAIYTNEAISIEISPFIVNSSLPVGCIRNIPSWYKENITDLRMSVMLYYIFNGLLTRLLPCLVLLFTTVYLVRCLCFKMVGLVKSVQESYSSNNKLRRTNVLVLVILIIFLVAELQDAVAFCIYSYELAIDEPRSVLAPEVDDIWDVYGMMVTLISYHCIFWIFFSMSSQFRSALKHVLCRCKCERSSNEDSVVRISFLRNNTRSGTSSTHF